MGESFVKKYWIGAVLGILILNSLILDYFLLFPKASQNIIPRNISLPNTTQISCPQSCVDQLNLSLTSLKESSSSSTAKATPSATPTPYQTSIQTKPVKEFFVPLGVGTGSSDEWTVIDGIGAKIDPSDYGDIKTVTFEVTARIPNGNQTIWIRLYNANTYQAVAGSELTLSGGTSTLLISSPISLASGNNLYQIQMKTQLKSTANIDMSRIRIKTN